MLNMAATCEYTAVMTMYDVPNPPTQVNTIRRDPTPIPPPSVASWFHAGQRRHHLSIPKCLFERFAVVVVENNEAHRMQNFADGSPTAATRTSSALAPSNSRLMHVGSHGSGVVHTR